MKKTKWTKDSYYLNQAVGSYRGVQIDRSTLNSGGHLYYIHWLEHVDRAAPRFKMSEPMRSLKAAKDMIDRLLEREAVDRTMIVQRLDRNEQKALWASRGRRKTRLYVV